MALGLLRAALTPQIREQHTLGYAFHVGVFEGVSYYLVSPPFGPAFALIGAREVKPLEDSSQRRCFVPGH